MLGEAHQPPADCPLCPRPARIPAAQTGARIRISSTGRCRASAHLDAQASDRGPRAGTERREPHGASIHRRLRGRAALRLAQAARACARRPTARAATTGSSCWAYASPMPCAACRRRTSRCPSRSRPAGRFSWPKSPRCRCCEPILALGQISHDSVASALALKKKDHRFAHGARHEADGLTLLASYHCSRYNTNTGVLTEAMFDAVMAAAKEAAGL